jgi:hypothetical protein
MKGTPLIWNFLGWARLQTAQTSKGPVGVHAGLKEEKGFILSCTGCELHCLVQIQISSNLLCAVYSLLLTKRSKDNRNASEALQHRVLSCRPHIDANSAMYSIR